MKHLGFIYFSSLNLTNGRAREDFSVILSYTCLSCR